MKKITLIFLLFSSAIFSQVGIGTASPDPSSSLDIESSDSGLLIPRIALTATTSQAPVTSPVTSLLIYNTATVADVVPGFYYWDGSVWKKLTSGNTVNAQNGINISTTIPNASVVNPYFELGGNLIRNSTISQGAFNMNYDLNGAGIFRINHNNTTSSNAVTYPFGVSRAGASEYTIGSDANYVYNQTWNSKPLVVNSQGNNTLLNPNTGNVGIGVMNPAYNLELNGTFGYGNGTAGSYKSRTETRNDAGQIASQSGFFETSVPTNFPAGASSWWHLIDTRHSNNVNNYALQIAGSFFDQDLWFRKTNNNSAQTWSKLLTSNSGWQTIGNSGTNAVTNFIGTTDGIDFVTRTNNFERMRITAGGNVGIGTPSPSYKLDNVGFGGSNVDFRTSGRMWTNSPFGGMWLSDLQDSFMGNISTTQFGFWSSTVGWNALNINKTTGYVGIGTSTPSARLQVISDGDNLPIIYGVNINSSAGTTSFGVRGECGSSGLGSAGVSGVSTNSGQNEIGILGDYSLWGAGVFGLGWAGLYTDMPTTRDFGVFGTVNFFTGTGVYGRNTNTAVGSAYGVYSFGNMAVTGAKSASVPTTKGNQLVYSTESPEIWFEDVGGEKLSNGSVHIALDNLFLETIFVDNEHPLRVFIQEEGESNGLIVLKDSDNKGFTVKEKNGGTSNVSFSYRIMAKRRFYQNQRFGVDANQPFEDNLSKAKDIPVTTTDPIEMKHLVDEQTKLKESQTKK